MRKPARTGLSSSEPMESYLMFMFLGPNYIRL